MYNVRTPYAIVNYKKGGYRTALGLPYFDNINELINVLVTVINK